jgi:hypothetical protein
MDRIHDITRNYSSAPIERLPPPDGESLLQIMLYHCSLFPSIDGRHRYVALRTRVDPSLYKVSAIDEAFLFQHPRDDGLLLSPRRVYSGLFDRTKRRQTFLSPSLSYPFEDSSALASIANQREFSTMIEAQGRTGS